MSNWWADKIGSPTPQQPSAPTRYTSAPPAMDRGLPPVPQSKPRVTSDNFIEAAEQYQGGEGVQNSGRCPNCGSGNYFAQKASIISQSGMASAPPRCYDCNYVPGRTTQGMPPV